MAEHRRALEDTGDKHRWRLKLLRLGLTGAFIGICSASGIYLAFFKPSATAVEGICSTLVITVIACGCAFYVIDAK